MGASLYVGKNLRLEAPGDDGGAQALKATPLDCENMSWASITELEELAERCLGIPREDWPFYPDVELEEEFSLEDVRAKCRKLRVALAHHTPESLPDNYWLRFLTRTLQEGLDFCAKGW